MEGKRLEGKGGGGITEKQQKTGGGEIKMYKRCSKGRTIGGKERKKSGGCNAVSSQVI